MSWPFLNGEAVPVPDDPLYEGVAALAQFFVGDGTLGDTLSRVADLACTSLSADMAGITMMVEGKLRTAVFTDPQAPEIDSHQYARSSGPCVQALGTGRVQRIDDTSTETRWPEFAKVAAERGICSTLSLPLTRTGERLGALNLYSRTLAHFAGYDERRSAAWTAAAATVLANASAYHDFRELSQNLEQALKSRATIDYAIGIIMSAGGRDPDQAFQVLVRASQRENKKLRDIAQRLVAAAQERRPGISPG